jgi:TPR repeat protein
MMSISREAAYDACRQGKFESVRPFLDAQANAGDAQAQFWLGALYTEGQSAEPQTAFIWCRLAAQQGLPLAQANLASMYLRGYGTQKDLAAAAVWYEKSALQNDAVSQFELANLYFRGEGIPQDHEKSAEWYKCAAKQGHYPAQARLGYCYANGLGVEKNRVQAFLWLSLAARHGVGTALKALEEVGAQMSVEERRDGSALLAGFGQQPAQERVILNPALA